MASTDVPSQIDWQSVFNGISPEDPQSSINSVSDLAVILRNTPRKELVRTFESLCTFTEHHHAVASTLCSNVHQLVTSSNLTLLLTESGITGNNGFASELIHRIERRIIPEPVEASDFRSVLRTVFF